MDKPWDHGWSLLLPPEVKNWWAENFKDHNTLILTGVRNVAHTYQEMPTSADKPAAIYLQQAETHHRMATVVQTSTRRIDRSELCR